MQTRRRMSSQGSRPVSIAGTSWAQTPAGATVDRLTEANSKTNAQYIPHSSSITTSTNIQQSNAFSFSTPINNNDSTLKMANRNEKEMVNHTDWNHPYLKYPTTSKDSSASWNTAGNSSTATTIAAVAAVAGTGSPFLSRRPAVISPYALDASSSHPNIYSCVSNDAVDDHCDTTSNASNMSSVTGDDDNAAASQGTTSTEKSSSRIAILPDFVIGAESPSTQKLRPRRKVTSYYDDDCQEEGENKNEDQSRDYKGNKRDVHNVHLLNTLKSKKVHASALEGQQENKQEHLQEHQEKYYNTQEPNSLSKCSSSSLNSLNSAPADTARTENNDFHQVLKGNDPEILLYYGALALVRLYKSSEKKCQQFLETEHHGTVRTNGVSLVSPSFSLPPPSLPAKPLSATIIQQANNNLTSSQEVTSSSLPEITKSKTRPLRSKQTSRKNLKRKNNNCMSNDASKKQRNNKGTILSSCPSRLAMPQDPEYLNSLHCFVRSELLELFCCTYDNNRVGLRCVFCGTQKKTNGNKKKKKNLPHNFCTTPLSSSASPMAGMQDTPKMTKMSAFYPKSLGDLYRNVCAWQQKHFRTCPYIPQSVRDEYTKLKLQDKSRGKTKYWATSARALGLVDNSTTVTKNTNCRADNNDEFCKSTTPQRGHIDNTISVGVRFVGSNHNTE